MARECRGIQAPKRISTIQANVPQKEEVSEEEARSRQNEDGSEDFGVQGLTAGPKAIATMKIAGKAAKMEQT